MISSFHSKTPSDWRAAAAKASRGERLSAAEGEALYACEDLPLLSALATSRRREINGDKVFYNRNFHIEPTNVCVNHCVFCSYRRQAGAAGSWEYSIDDILELCRPYAGQPVTEVHIVGGVHPERDIYFYASLLRAVKQCLPQVTIKAFTAVEVDYMARKAGWSYEKSLSLLKENGLEAMPGGGAEIFDDTVRRRLCPDKTGADAWLQIHETAHRLGIRTNATMLFGHIETPAHRIDHLLRLRELQDKTGGFDAFIPLKYKSRNNLLGVSGEVSTEEVLRNFAVCRLVLDNIPHLKAYWPMLGKEVMQRALSFGADDIDGTIDDSTKIYSMAGADEQHPTLTVEELENYVSAAGYRAVERNTFYNGEWRVENGEWAGAGG
ncbi:MAG: aminofutalosine synthase MqnE [Prevotellaceae bacterium]|jgi:aminodeoxyfutalosine synthase|nr:aminofutalosine synthase MqnE [Prevotellaceae bacterium]